FFDHLASLKVALGGMPGKYMATSDHPLMLLVLPISSRNKAVETLVAAGTLNDENHSSNGLNWLSRRYSSISIIGRPEGNK
ncbi:MULTISPECIES: hypothetical protein, partial [unclassified Pseudomonas]|uniref:hypothetical protein n=1 Tax=unclassified Pseudomonas TaxID=196821 RepID=UPI001C490D45